MSMVRRFSMGAGAVVLASIGLLGAPPVSAAPASADLAVTVQPQNQVITIGMMQISPIRFTATVVNYGPSTANNVALSETISPSGFFPGDFSTIKVSASIPCTVSGPGLGPFTVTCTGSSLAPEATDQVVVTYSAWNMHNSRDSVSATVSSATPDPNLANNTASGMVSFICYNRDTCYFK